MEPIQGAAAPEGAFPAGPPPQPQPTDRPAAPDGPAGPRADGQPSGAEAPAEGPRQGRRRRGSRGGRRRSGAGAAGTGGTDASGKPTGIARVDPSFTARADTPEGPSTALIGAHYLYIAGNFQLVSDTPGANFRSQPGFAEFPAIG